MGARELAEISLTVEADTQEFREALERVEEAADEFESAIEALSEASIGVDTGEDEDAR